VDKTQDLRRILAQNIKKNRNALHISQAKLAEYAEISLSYLLDIEYCKTWVSDKTLKGLARALNMEAYQLLMPIKDGEGGESNDAQALLTRQIAELINEKRIKLKKETDETMKDLLSRIIRFYSG
jgi:transcriptional regulator with XRE-family HTH domain